jgi:hypothetical protein
MQKYIGCIVEIIYQNRGDRLPSVGFEYLTYLVTRSRHTAISPVRQGCLFYIGSWPCNWWLECHEG